MPSGVLFCPQLKHIKLLSDRSKKQNKKQTKTINHEIKLDFFFLKYYSNIISWQLID